MALFTATALSDQFGYKAVSIEKPTGEKIDVFPMLKNMGLVVKKRTGNWNYSSAFNTRVGGVVGNKVAKLKFDVKIMEDKKVDDISQLNVAGFNRQQLRSYETFLYAQAFRKSTYKYSIEDMIDAEKIFFGRGIAPTVISRLMAQRDRDREKATLNEFLKALYHFNKTGIMVWDIDNATGKEGLVKKDTSSGAWKTKTVKGDTAVGINHYGESIPMLKRYQNWDSHSTLTDKFQLLGDIDVDITTQTSNTGALYGHMHLDGIGNGEIITVMPQNVLNELATQGGRFPAAMAQRDMQTGEILQGKILGANYVIYNNLPKVDLNSGVGSKSLKEIKFIKYVKGAVAPLVYISNTGLDAIMDYPDYVRESATTHRILETTNEWELTFVKEYTNLIYVGYGAKRYNKAATV